MNKIFRTSGHFTLLVANRANAVGCAIIHYQAGGATPFASYLVCDYSFNNVGGQPIYVKGPSTSNCQTGSNPNYPGLCSVNENIPATI